MKWPITQGGKEGKSKVIASCGSLEENFRECSKSEGVGVATRVDTLGVDLRTKTRQLGATEKATWKKCDVRFPLIKKNRVWAFASTIRLKVEEVDGSSNRQEGVGAALIVHGS